MVAAIAALMLFRVAGDARAAAGALAGMLFGANYVLALVLGIVLHLAQVTRGAGERRRAIVLVSLAAALALVLTPLIAMHGAGLPIPFAWLHGAAGVLHLALLGVALDLAWRLTRLPTA